MSVKRYGEANYCECGNVDIRERDDGEYVEFEDYEKLESQLAALKEENEAQLLRHEIERDRFKEENERVIRTADYWKQQCRAAVDRAEEMQTQNYALKARVAELENQNSNLQRNVAALVEIVQNCGCEDEEPANEG